MPFTLPRHRYLEPALVEHDLGSAAKQDPFGDRVHLFLAAAWCFLLGWPTSVVEIASIPLVVFFVLRTPKIWRTWGSFAVQPVTLAIAAWVAWQALSLAWSPDPRQGLWELSANRWMWVLWVLWPMMARRPVLIWAVAAGFLCGNLSQVGHAIGQALGVPWLVWPRLENRNSGWWDPVVGGSLLVGALGLHLPGAVMGRGRERLVGIAGAAATLTAIFATGTRGAWLAAAALVGVTVVVAAGWWLVGARKAAGGVGWRPFVTVAVLLIAAVIGAWLVRGTIAARYEQGRAEVRAALERQDYSSDTGRRILMWKVALAAAAEHPVRGVGAGGYRAWGRAYLAEQSKEATADDAIHAHAHSAPLHILATTGAVGLGLAGVVILLALYGGFTQLGPRGLGSYAAGPAFGIVGLMLAGLFDPVHLNAQTGALLATLAALCLLSRPPISRPRE